MKPQPLQPPDVEAIFNTYPLEIREKCLYLRALIYDVAASDPRIGPLEETLKWGEPSYIPSKTKSGSMVRLHHYATKPFDFSLYFICSTDLVERFREKYPKTFRYGGNRSLEFMLTDVLPEQELRDCIREALTYNL